MRLTMDVQRKIIHIDMDAFYASVEQRDRPELRGRPVIVGGAPHGRGVVAACSYEARRFGVHSAMASSQAFRRCPQAVFLQPRFDVYRDVSHQIRQVFCQFTDLVEPLSLDEAFLDVTVNTAGEASATRIARTILGTIHRRTGGLTASAGVSYNKFLAKVASDFRKPNGLTVIRPDQAEAFLSHLPIRKFFGVGRATEKRMLTLGIRTGADLRKIPEALLVRHFGKAGRYFFRIVRGEDPRPVEPHWERKSLGKEITLSEDIDDRQRMLSILADLAAKVAGGLQREGRRGLTVTVKVKYDDFQTVTRAETLPHPVDTAEALLRPVPDLLAGTAAGRRKVRLLGIAVSNFTDDTEDERRLHQLPLPFPPLANFGGSVESTAPVPSPRG